jgi:hypothetical protein
MSAQLYSLFYESQILLDKNNIPLEFHGILFLYIHQLFSRQFDTIIINRIRGIVVLQL